MAILTQARAAKVKINGGEYQFLELTGNWDGLSQSGLVTFSAGLDLIDHPDNPSSIDTRRDDVRQIFCRGRSVEVEVRDDSGSYRHPSCIPELFISSWSPFDPKSRVLSLELVDILGLVSPINPDYWRNPEDEARLEESDRETDEETGKVKYWWTDWEKKGTESCDRILKTILGKLKVACSGSISGQIRTPWTLSGGLLAACGEMAFKSNSPSFIWSDYRGQAKITDFDSLERLKLSIRTFTEFAPASSAEIVEQLIAVGNIPEIAEKESEDILEELLQEEDPEKGTCSIEESYGPASSYNPDEGLVETILSITETCTRFELNSKILTTTVTERKGMIFPDMVYGNRGEMIVSSIKVETDLFDSSGGNLIKKTTVVSEPFGKVFAGWLNNYFDFVVPGFEDADRLKERHDLIISSRTVKDYIYNKKKKLIRTVSKTQMPRSAIMSSHFASGYPSTVASFLEMGMVDAATETEIWKKEGKNELHQRFTSQCFELANSGAITRIDDYYKKRRFEDFDDPIPTIDVIKYRLLDSIRREIYNEKVEISLVEPSVRLAMIRVDYKEETSRSGLANAPATEYLPDITQAEGAFEKPLEDEDWIEKTKIYRINYKDSCTNVKSLPGREILNIGTVWSESQLKAIADAIWNIRLGQVQVYRVKVPLDNEWINGDFEPAFRVDILDRCDEIWTSHLAHAIAVNLTPTSNEVQVELLWRGSRKASEGVDIDTGYPLVGGVPIYPQTGEQADPVTGWPISPTTGNPYHPGTGLDIDPVTNFPVNSGGQSIDPTTNLPIDPISGYPTNGTNLVDPATNLPIDPVSGYPTNGTNLIDPITGWQLDETYKPINPITGISQPWTAPLPTRPTPPVPQNEPQYQSPLVEISYPPNPPLKRWEIQRPDRWGIPFDQLWQLQSL